MDDGLLFVLSEPGNQVPEAEFHHWYDHDHAPARLMIPGIHAGHRYRATDGLRPGWLAQYPLCLAALESPPYRALRNRSPYERNILSRLETLDRRVYQRLSTTGDASDRAARFLLAVALSGPDIPALEAWYHEEHCQALGGIPGWQRSACYRLVSGTAPQLLALHELGEPFTPTADTCCHGPRSPCPPEPSPIVTVREIRLFVHHNTVHTGQPNSTSAMSGPTTAMWTTPSV